MDKIFFLNSGILFNISVFFFFFFIGIYFYLKNFAKEDFKNKFSFLYLHYIWNGFLLSSFFLIVSQLTVIGQAFFISSLLFLYLIFFNRFSIFSLKKKRRNIQKKIIVNELIGKAKKSEFKELNDSLSNYFKLMKLNINDENIFSFNKTELLLLFKELKKEIDLEKKYEEFIFIILKNIPEDFLNKKEELKELLLFPVLKNDIDFLISFLAEIYNSEDFYFYSGIIFKEMIKQKNKNTIDNIFHIIEYFKNSKNNFFHIEYILFDLNNLEKDKIYLQKIIDYLIDIKDKDFFEKIHINILSSFLAIKPNIYLFLTDNISEILNDKNFNKY